MASLKRICIIPWPSSIKTGGGNFTLSPLTPVLSDKSIGGIDSIITFLLDKTETATGMLLHSKDRTIHKVDRGIFFELNPENQSVSEEAYRISITRHRIDIGSGSRKGLFYGAVTLFQIIYSAMASSRSSNKSRVKIPSMQIHDVPRFSWRGLLLDCSRHFMSKDFIKMVIDVLALYKLNRLHWHLVDDQGWRLEIKKYPKLTSVGAWRGNGKNRYGGFYTQDDVAEIVRHAESRNVEIIPEIEIPGHSVAALAAYPEYSCTGGPFEPESKWGIFNEVYCAGNEKTFGFLYDVLDEVCSMFPSRFVHIGGDEVPPTRWNECPKCRRLMNEKGLDTAPDLENFVISSMARHLSLKGKTTICWDEVIEGRSIPDIIVQYWRAFVDLTIPKRAAAQGHDVIVSPTSHCYLDYPTWQIDTPHIASLEPVPDDMSEEEKKRILGVECNMWTEHAPEEWVFPKILPRLAGLAEVGWTDRNKTTRDTLIRRLEGHRLMLGNLGIDTGEIQGPDLTRPIMIKRPAIIVSLLGTHDNLVPERAFARGRDRGVYLSGRPVKKGEYYSIEFQRMFQCNHIKMMTFDANITDCRIENGIVQISRNSVTFDTVAMFKDGIAEANFKTRKIKTIKITITEDQESWVMISDIVIDRI